MLGHRSASRQRNGIKSNRNKDRGTARLGRDDVAFSEGCIGVWGAGMEPAAAELG